VDVLIDTNVIIDIAQSREPFVPLARKILSIEQLGLCVTASAITDVYYLQRRHAGHAAARAFLGDLFNLFHIIEVTEADCRRALMMPMHDYEDALQACCAYRAKCDYIITRDERHFEGSPVPAKSPEQFLEEWDKSHAQP
jgi:predicted nucleic acid-binding protein